MNFSVIGLEQSRAVLRWPSSPSDSPFIIFQQVIAALVCSKFGPNAQRVVDNAWTSRERSWLKRLIRSVIDKDSSNVMQVSLTNLFVELLSWCLETFLFASLKIQDQVLNQPQRSAFGNVPRCDLTTDQSHMFSKGLQAVANGQINHIRGTWFSCHTTTVLAFNVLLNHICVLFALMAGDRSPTGLQVFPLNNYKANTRVHLQHQCMVIKHYMQHQNRLWQYYWSLSFAKRSTEVVNVFGACTNSAMHFKAWL